MFDQHQVNYNKLNTCLETLKNFQDMRARSKLWTFYNHCRRVWTKLDTEFVTCRRYKRLTERYKDLEVEFDASIVVFEQYSTIAALTY